MDVFSPQKNRPRYWMLQPFFDTILSWLVVEPTPLKNISQIGSFPKVGVNIKRYLKPPPSQSFEGWSSCLSVWLSDTFLGDQESKARLRIYQQSPALRQKSIETSHFRKIRWSFSRKVNFEIIKHQKLAY